MNSKRMKKPVVVLAIVIMFVVAAVSGVMAADGFYFKLHIKDANLGYNSAAHDKYAGQCVTLIQVNNIDRDSILYQKKSVNMIVINGESGAQMTRNVVLSSSDQIPSIPSSAILNYIYNGNYYGWIQKPVILRANSTTTNPGFTVEGYWYPNYGTSYSGQ